MEIQFERDTLHYLCCTAWGEKTFEETGEIRLAEQERSSDEILGAWGQPILLEKEWSSGSVSVSGGVNVWVLLRGQEDPVQCVDGWIPFRQNWELRDSERDGAVNVQCSLRSVDARMTGAGKLIVTVRLGLELQALEPCTAVQYKTGQLPEDIYIYEQTEALRLPIEVGEKRTTLEEEAVVEPSSPALQRVLFYRMNPEVHDQRIMGDKLVFRGAVKLRLVYMGQDGHLAALDGEFPVSQYIQLDGEYGSEASACILPMVTAAEVSVEETGKVVAHCDVLWQYVIQSDVQMSVVLDAYSNTRAVELMTSQLNIPNGTLWQEGKQLTDCEIQGSFGQLVDCAAMVSTRVDEKSKTLQSEGSMRILYYDENDLLQSAVTQVSAEEQLPAVEASAWQCVYQQSPSVSCKMGDSLVTAHVAIPYALSATNESEMKSCSGLEAEDEQHKREDRPSVILRRADERPLWYLAKACGSSEQAIRQANEITDELIFGRMLLIPVE